MLETINRPVIFLAFANDRNDDVQYLRNLPEEARQVRDPLLRARSDGLCEFVELANATAADIFRVFQDADYRDRIAVFHYGGHANGYQLLLESSAGDPVAADAGGLAAFLGQQKSLQLAFLNGCSTRQQVQGLLEADVASVIATSRAIDDNVAMLFAKRFYQGLAGGASIRVAYNEAEASIQTEQGDNTRSAFFGGAGRREQVPVDADRWPWQLHVRDGAESVADWSLPHAVGDPLFGLPSLEEQDLPNKPFRHLHWFDREHADVFFGRGHQIRDLYELVTGPNSPPITLLYGQSGVGKSSMLASGLIPRLTQSCEVRYVRRNHDLGLLRTMKNAIDQVDDEMSVEASIDMAGDWLDVEERLGKPLVVVIDQVEECFTRPNSRQPHELDDFLGKVQATFGRMAARPQGRLILGFRKEWLAEIERRLLDRKLPRAKVFLERLGRRGIIEAVSGPAKSSRLTTHYGLTMEDGLPEIIADDLLGDRDSAIAPTLQILLTKMWDKATERDQSHPHFDQELYRGLKREGILLNDFLDQQLEQLRAWRTDVVDSGLVLDLLSLHTTPLGTAEQCGEDELPGSYPHREDVLDPLVQRCKDLYLLVDPSRDNQTETGSTRLSHDTLAPLIRARFDDSDKPGQRARRILENRRVDWQDENQGTPLDIPDLRIVEQGQAGTRALDPVEQRLLEASRRERSKRLRLRKMLKILGSVAVVLIGLLGITATIFGISARNHARAVDSSLAIAKNAIDETLKQVGNESLKDVPQMEDLRVELLEKAEAMYAQLAKQDVSGDQQFRFEQTLAHFRIGEIYRSMERRATASENYEMAISKLDSLIEGSTDNDVYRLLSATVQTKYGYLLSDDMDASKQKQAESLYDSAFAQLDAANADSQQQIGFLTARALIHNNRGSLFESTDRTADAVSEYDSAIELLEPWREKDPVTEIPKKCLLYLAYAHNNRAGLYESIDAKDEFAEYATAIDLMNTLHDSFPKDRTFKSKLVMFHNNLAGLLCEHEKYSDARLHNDRALQLSQELVRALPDQQDLLGFCFLTRKLIMEELKEETEAEISAQNASEIYTELVNLFPDNATYQESLDSLAGGPAQNQSEETEDD